MKLKNLQKILNKAVHAHQNGNYLKAKDCYLYVLNYLPENKEILSQTAILLGHLDQYEEAVKYMQKVVTLYPNDVVALTNCGFFELKNGLLHSAEINLLKSMNINPNNIQVYLNLTALYTAKSDHQSALKYASKALNLDPSSAKANNNLGQILSLLGDQESALFSFETALILDPNLEEAAFNIGTIYSKLGNTEKAINIFEKSLLTNFSHGFDNLPRTKYALSYEYLSTGRLAEGWDFYDFGFHKSVPFEYRRVPNRIFNKPRWKGENLEGRRLLIWGEQGIGDELLFMSCFNNLPTTFDEIIIECQERLVTLIQRSFPKFKVRKSEYYSSQEGILSIYDDYDFQIPMGGLMALYRRKINDFSNSKPFIIIDTEKKKILKQELEKLGSLKKVGICWRSGKLNIERAIDYTALIDWKNILSNTNYEFINLQYGDCEQEIIEIENLTNRIIHRWSDLDLKNDFEHTMALISNLDLVITVGTAVNTMAGSLGVNTLLLGYKGWVNQGTEFYPWFPNTKCIFPDRTKSVSTTLAEVEILLNSLYSN
jgi:tetratricopeptide (TPR) repeat protein